MTFRSMPAPLHVNLQHLKPLANLRGMGMTLRSMPGSLYANLAHEEHATQPGGLCRLPRSACLSRVIIELRGHNY